MAKTHSTDKKACVPDLSHKKDEFEESLFGEEGPRVVTRAEAAKMRKALAEAKLVRDLEQRSPREADSIVFMPQAMVRIALPYAQPKDKEGNLLDLYTRETSMLRMTIKTMRPEYGLIHGAYSRLVMAYVSSVAIRTGSPVIEIGSGRELCRKLQLPESGDGIQRLKMHLLRFRYSLFYFEWHDISQKLENVTHTKDLLFPAVSAAELWQERNENGKPTLKEGSDSYIRLSQEFYEELRHRPMPLDLRIYAQLNPSALAMDVYTYLSYRSSFTRYRTLLTWTELKNLFGASYQTMPTFRYSFRSAMKKISKLYLGLRVEDVPEGIVLLPGTLPSVPKQTYRPETKILTESSGKTEPQSKPKAASPAKSKKKSSGA